MKSLLATSLRIPLAGALLIAAAALAACEDGGAPPTPSPSTEAEQLEGIPFAELVRAAFPEVKLEDDVSGFRLAGAPEWTIQPLGRLVGRLTEDASVKMAAFFNLEGPEDARAPGLGLWTGVYAVLAELGPDGKARAATVTMLSEEGDRLLPLEEAQAEGVLPFQQGQQQMETTFSVWPRLVVDVEGDGREELVLVNRFGRRGISWEEHQVYQQVGNQWLWQRLGQPLLVPAQAVLNYIGNVAAGTALARRWEPTTRLVDVWSWLAQEKAMVPPELVRKLVPSGDIQEARATQDALAFLRRFFEEAYASFSPDFQVRQPWPGFVNGFRNVEGITLESISAPTFPEAGEAELDIEITSQQREGGEAVQRQFRVSFALVKLEGQWRLHGIEAEEQRGPE